MYRDDPLDDEMELRYLLGDPAVNALAEPDVASERTPVEAAVDVLRVLQGWVSDEDAARWFVTEQRRLDGERPIDLLRRGGYEDVEEAARVWSAAQG